MRNVFSPQDLVTRRQFATNYEEIRDQIQTGDVIAFGGTKRLSSLIKTFTRSPISHVGIVTVIEDPEVGESQKVLYESTSLSGFAGVQIHYLSHTVFDYIGDVWHLPLSVNSRNKLNTKKLKLFLRNQLGKPYDSIQAAKSALDLFEDTLSFLKNTEDYSKFFCSELVTAALEASGVIGEINASEITPIELCRFKIYGQYNNLRGNKKIPRYNSIEA